jgi:ATP-binding cassette subfamily B (MDR/TAP) protein 1
VGDAVQAYLNNRLLEEVHVWAPKGIPVPPGYVLKLLKAIYGMPQGGREYWKLIRSVILGLGFTQSDHHPPCFFYRRTDAGFIIVMTYVDDMTITTDNELIRIEVFDAINNVVEVKDLGVLESFLGIQFKYNKQLHYWHISQSTYIKDLCATMGLHQESAKAAFTPEMKRSWSVETSTAKDDTERLRVSQYSPRSKIGSIMWAMVCCRPDLMHSLKNPSQFMTDPGDMVVDVL